MSLENTRPRAARGSVPKEIVSIVAVALAVFVAAWLGGMLASVIPAERASIWLTAGAYLTPAATMFAIYWLLVSKN